MSDGLTDESLTKRFEWWWKSVFVDAKKLGNYPQNLTKAFGLPTHLLSEDSEVSQASSKAWRKTKSPIPGQMLGLLWHTREQSAFFYELGKRITGKYEFEKSWIGLSEEQKKVLEARWPDEFEQHVICEYRKSGSHLAETQWNQIKAPLPEEIQRHFNCAGAPAKPGWTGPLPDSWNLHLNNGTLSKEFIALIKSERDRLKIPNPRQHAGRALKPISWRPIELLDINNGQLRSLSDSERSQISKAKKRWEELKKTLTSKRRRDK